jgi:hypothetical protein
MPGTEHATTADAQETVMRATGTKSIAHALLALLICLSAACTTMRPITADESGEKIRQALKPGDTVHVLTKTGVSRSFEVTAIGETSLAGKTVRMMGVGSSDTWGAPIDMPYADIAQIEVRRVQALKTIGIVAVVVLADVAIASSRAGSARCCISR